MGGASLLVLAASAPVQEAPRPAPRQVHPVPVPSPPVQPIRPPKKWTAEELTTPVMHFGCDLLAYDGRRGKLEFVVNGGRAYPETRKERQVVGGFARTKQSVRFEADELGLFRGPVAEEVAVWPTTGKFFVRLTGPDLPAPPYGTKGYRSVLIAYNYGMLVTITVNAVPRAPLAMGFCSVKVEPQAPLSAQEAARESST